MPVCAKIHTRATYRYFDAKCARFADNIFKSGLANSIPIFKVSMNLQFIAGYKIASTSLIF
jgi:hypothetical protein